MTDEPEKKSGGFPLEGLTVQGLGGALAAFWMLHQKANGHFYEAAYESALGTIITGSMYCLYWLLKPRILKWRKG